MLGPFLWSATPPEKNKLNNIKKNGCHEQLITSQQRKYEKVKHFFRSELPAAVLLQTNLFFTASAFSVRCPLLSGVPLMPAKASPLKLTAGASASRLGFQDWKPALGSRPSKPEAAD